MATFCKTNCSPVGDFRCFNFPETCAKQLPQCDERLCFTGKLTSVPFVTSEDHLQCHHLPTLCTKLTASFRVLNCCLYPALVPHVLVQHLMHGGATSVQISWSLRYQRQEDGKRGAPTVQARPFWKHHKGKRHSNMEYFKLLDKKIH